MIGKNRGRTEGTIKAANHNYASEEEDRFRRMRIRVRIIWDDCLK